MQRTSDPRALPAGRSGREWLPAGALPCVWMEAGLLSYRLCHLEYDCERCSLDAALAARAPTAAGARAGGAAPRRRLEFPPDRRYHPSHAWLRSHGPARQRFGLDMLAARLLAHARAVILPPAGSSLRLGRPACWVQYEGELIPFRAPVSGQVLAPNARLCADAELLAASPYDEGWLLDVRPDECSAPDPELMDADAMRHHTALQLGELRAARRRATMQDPRVGRTLADGGRRLATLKQVLGGEGYRRLIRTILG